MIERRLSRRSLFVAVAGITRSEGTRGARGTPGE